MLTRSLLTAVVISGLLGSSSFAQDAHAAGSRGEPAVIVSTVRDSGAPVLAIDAEEIADLDCQAARAAAQAKLARGRVNCLRKAARGAAGFDRSACESERFRKYREATLDLPCDGASDVVGTYACQGPLCTCRGDDCEQMFDGAACSGSVSCAMSGDEAVCTCLPSH
jgi:hypothetical protein